MGQMGPDLFRGGRGGKKNYLQTIYPGRIKAMADCAKAEKQKSSPFLIEPNARARKLLRTVAQISKRLAYVFDMGVRTSCMKPTREPRMKAIGISIGRAPKAKGPTEALAKPETIIRIQQG